MREDMVTRILKIVTAVVCLGAGGCLLPLVDVSLQTVLDGAGAGLVGNSADSPTAEAITTEEEAALFDDGPVDLPVTIAKLDSPNPELITVTFTEAGGEAAQLVGGRPLNTESATGRYDITGAPDTINNPELARKVLVLNAATDAQTIVPVGPDGSFVAAIGGELEDTIVLTSLTATEDQASPMLMIEMDPNDSPSFVDTNAATISPDQQMMSDDQGNYYLSLVNKDETGKTYNLVRRNLAGTQVELLLDHADEEARLIVAASGDTVTYMNSLGQIKMLVIGASASPSLVRMATDDALQSIVSEVVVLDDNGVSAGADPDGLNFHKTRMALDGETRLVSQRTRTWPDGVTSLADVINLETLADFPLITTDQVNAVSAMDVGEPGRLYAAIQINGQGGSILYWLPLDDDPATAWDRREEVLKWPNYIGSIDVTDGGVVAFGNINDYQEFEALLYSEADGVRPINRVSTDQWYYMAPRVSKGGEFIILCRKGPSGSDIPNQFGYFRPGVDRAGELGALTSFTEARSCGREQQSYYIDTNYFIHFYRRAETGAPVQHAIIDPYDTPELADVLPENRYE